METGLIEHNPSLKRPILTMLDTVARMADEERSVIERAAAESWSSAFRQSPQAVCDVLVRNGAIEETLLVNGAPYEGSIEDVQLDENIDETAVVESSLCITDAGCAILEDYASEQTLRALYEQRPHYAPVFDAVIAACIENDGCDRAALEQVIEAALVSNPGVLAHGGEASQRVYPQYFMDALESAGGICWQGLWRATQSGASVLEADQSDDSCRNEGEE